MPSVVALALGATTFPSTLRKPAPSAHQPSRAAPRRGAKPFGSLREPQLRATARLLTARAGSGPAPEPQQGGVARCQARSHAQPCESAPVIASGWSCPSPSSPSTSPLPAPPCRHTLVGPLAAAVRSRPRGRPPHGGAPWRAGEGGPPDLVADTLTPWPRPAYTPSRPAPRRCGGRRQAALPRPASRPSEAAVEVRH